MKIPVRPTQGINLNRSSEEALSEAVGLGPERARRLIESRPLRSWDDLAHIEGFTTQIVEALRASGADLGDPAQADVKALSDEHRESLRREHTSGADVDEGVPAEGRIGVSPDHRAS